MNSAEPQAIGAVTINNLFTERRISLRVAASASDKPSPWMAWFDTAIAAVLSAAWFFLWGTVLVYMLPFAWWLAVNRTRESWAAYLGARREHERALSVCLDALRESEASQ